MQLKITFLLLAGFILASADPLSPSALATIAIVNPSFELPAQGDGGFSVGAITGWTISPGAVAGVQNPTDSMFSRTSDPESGLPDGK